MVVDAKPRSSAWHALGPDEALRVLGSDPDDGLDRAEVERRLGVHGPNALPEAPARPWWRTFLRQFRSPLIYILFVAAALAVSLGHAGDAVVILAVVCVNALIGMVQEGRAERSMSELRRLATLHSRVLRDGTERQIEAREIVPGDVLLLAAGDAVGADARLLELAQLQVAEAALTGESIPVTKAVQALPEATGLADRTCMVYAGTYVTAGRATALVVATGAHTEVGLIAGLTERAEEIGTPLERRIAQFGRWLMGAAFGLFALVTALGLLRGLPLSEVVMVAISQMVSMVPEGLPVAMTIALAVGVQRMAARGVIIRRLSAVETLGSTTVICSDKTGTLTRNQVTAVALWLPRRGDISVEGTGYAPQGRLVEADGSMADVSDPALVELLNAAAHCNDAALVAPREEGGEWSVLGDPTEGALLVLAAKAGLDPLAQAGATPRLAELPFDSGTKLMATWHRAGKTTRRVWIKGAPEAVLRLTHGSDGPDSSRAAAAAAESLASRALRVLAFATVDGDGPGSEVRVDSLVGRARLLGLIGQIDPPREEVKLAVAGCRAAGIRPIMVTGDHKLTGLAIARELGIARQGDLALDGQELESLGEEELREQVQRVAVFARVQPAQKLRIVEALQARGEVVAMTGDGVNDAPALARADVGVAMGRSGTEVAKSAAKVVVTDDNFATIVAGVEQGRVVYANLKKVILYLFATSMAEVLVLLSALVAGLPLPLAAVQILWINIVTEGTVTVNLVMDPPDGDEMRRRPVAKDERLLDRDMLKRVALMTPLIAGVTLGWFAWRLSGGVPLELARTETFTVLAMCQWFNVLSCQSATRSALELGLLRNPWLLGGLALSVGLQALVIYVPPLNALFHTVALPPASLLPLLLVASLVLWVEEARKLLLRWLGSR
jgi:Ca2+-transporting ATPase